MSLKRPLTYHYYNNDYQLLMGTKQSTLSPSQQQHKRAKRSTSHGSSNTGLSQSTMTTQQNTNKRPTASVKSQIRQQQQQQQQQQPQQPYFTHEPKQVIQNVALASPTFNEQQCLQWFQYYADPDTPTSISPEGMQRFLEDLGISIEEKMAIVIAWRLNAATMGYITQDEWMTGMRQLRVDNNEVLVKRCVELEAALRDPSSFKELYRYTFDYGKTKGQKCMEVDVACALWSILLGEASMVHQFILFLQQEVHPVRAINRDQWNSFYEFITTVSEDLSDHDEMAAWPVLFDEFVDWKRNALTQQLGVS